MAQKKTVTKKKVTKKKTPSKNIKLSNPKTIKDLKAAPYNPRTITDEQLGRLQKAMQEFGDLSGIVVNVTTGHVIGGHQRIKHLEPSWQITKQAHKDKVGTVAKGYIDTPFGQWQYREVKWDEKKEKMANIAANQHGGEFDYIKLDELLMEFPEPPELELMGFDPDFDISSLHNITPEGDLPEKEVTVMFTNKCPKCGHEY